MIRTGLKRIPWHWVAILCITNGAGGLAQNVIHGAPMQRLLKRFTEDPWHLSLIESMGPWLAVFIAPYISWKSDRIWTWLGRRKPFMLTGFALMALVIFVAPSVRSYGLLVTCVFLGFCSLDVGYFATWSPLFYEVVPSPQRGRGSAVKRGVHHVFFLSSNYFLFSQWTHVYHFSLPVMGKFEIAGSYMMYYVVGALVVLAFLNLAFNVHETKPENPLPRERFHPYRFVRDLFGDRQWLVIYLLVFCQVALGAGLGGLMSTAMQIDQFGYTEKQLGQYIAVPGSILNLFVVMPVAFFLADRIDRHLLFRLGLWLSTLHALSIWGVVQLFGPPAIWAWVLLGFFGNLVDQVAGIAIEPLMFDLVPPDKMGTMHSGTLIVARVLGALSLPIIGQFARQYSFWKFGRAGEGIKQVYDYSGGYLMVFLLGVAACVVYAYFEALYRKGKIVAYV